MTFQAFKDYSIYIPYCTVQYYISLTQYLTLCFFSHSDTFYGQRLLSLKNNGKVHLHLIIQYENNTDIFGSNTEKILDGHVVQIKDAHWMNLLDVE